MGGYHIDIILVASKAGGSNVQRGEAESVRAEFLDKRGCFSRANCSAV